MNYRHHLAKYNSSFDDVVDILKKEIYLDETKGLFSETKWEESAFL